MALDLEALPACASPRPFTLCTDMSPLLLGFVVNQNVTDVLSLLNKLRKMIKIV